MINLRILLVAGVLLSVNLFAQDRLPQLQVFENNRYLCRDDGSPFFWLGDTAWELFLKLNYQDANLYFEDRISKGFNLIQITALSENDHHTIEATNQAGYKPLLNGNPETPDIKPGENNDYWDYVDQILKLAESKGLYIGLLPTWGEYVTTQYRDGIVNSIFNTDNAFHYGKFIGNRYKEFTNIVWILGGDRASGTDEAKAIWRALAKGLAIGISGKEDYSQMLMTYHPVGKSHSTDYFTNEKWMDFNAVQSGHGDRILNWKMIEKDYKMYPDKPIIDLESSYPFLATSNQIKEFTDFYARRAAYWSVFSGSFGHTYGHHGIWNFIDTNENSSIIWTNAINAASSNQMGYLKRLIELFPFYERIPDQSIIASNPGLDIDHIAATRGETFALVYTPINRPFVIQMGKIKGEFVTCKWYNPRENNDQIIGVFKNAGYLTFTPPEYPQVKKGKDWVLILETQDE